MFEGRGECLLFAAITILFLLPFLLAGAKSTVLQMFICNFTRAVKRITHMYTVISA